MPPTEQIRFLRGLRAVRRYADRLIKPSILVDILDTVRWTGSGKNRQPWEPVVVQERARLQQLATCGQFGSERRSTLRGGVRRPFYSWARSQGKPEPV